jgi:hypothetical protein
MEMMPVQGGIIMTTAPRSSGADKTLLEHYCRNRTLLD